MWKIIIKNIDKQKSLVYGISIALFSAIIFTITSLLDLNEAVNLGGEAENVKIVFVFYYFVILMAGLLFIVYSIRLYVKCRMKDYAVTPYFRFFKEKVSFFHGNRICDDFFRSNILWYKHGHGYNEMYFYNFYGYRNKCEFKLEYFAS